MNKKLILTITIIGIAFIGAVLFVFVGKNKIDEKNQKNSYNFLSVERGDVTQTVKIDGTVMMTQEMDLRFQASGVVEKINFKIGDEIKKGDVIASLNSRDQKIAVKQREAGLAQAKASLNLKLAGVSDEDIAVYQSRVDNAKNNIETAKNSTAEDVKNSEARVSSAKIALDSAIISLETIEKQNDVDLSISYEGAQRAIDSSLLTIEKTLDDVKDILEDDVLDGVFSVKNSQYKSESYNKYSQLSSSFKIVLAESKEVGMADYTGIDSMLKEIKENLSGAQSLLDSVFNGLVSTITSSALTQADLENHKTNINNLRTGINTAISNIENREQSILQIRTGSITKINSAKAAINTAQAALSLEEAGLNSAKSKADSQNVQAENSLELADKELALKKSSPRGVDIAYLQALVREATASVDLAQENLMKTSISSPVDGRILDIKFEIGESVNSSNSFVELTTNEKKVEANIPEIEVGKVSIGDQAEITLDAFEDMIFKGKIISIDPINTNIQGVIYYKADIAFNDATSSEIVLPGMTASIDILTGQKNNALNLPGSSIKKEGNRFYIQEFENGQIKLRYIEVGLIGDKKIEIVSGIKQGDKVVDFALETN